MKFHNADQHYVLVLEKGEELTAELEKFCETMEITSGWIQGLGGALDAEMGFYNLAAKGYEWHKLDSGPYEITGLQGNISQYEGTTVFHMHASLAGSDLLTRTGHINRLTVGGTVELLITPLNANLVRSKDPETGLNTIS